MLRAFGIKLAVQQADGEPDDEERAALEMELIDLRVDISDHRHESERIFTEFDLQQADAEANLRVETAGVQIGTSEYAAAVAIWKPDIDRIRAERVSVARDRREKLDEMLAREAELVQILGEGW